MLAQRDTEAGKEYSLVSVNCPNVIIETIKRAEDGNGIVIRMYESENAYTKAKLTVRRPFAQAQICNLLEEAESAASVSENVIAVTLKPLEVVTVKVF